MPAASTNLQAITDRLQDMIFHDEWERRWFIDEWIASDEPTHAMAVALTEQRRELGPIFVRFDEDDDFSTFEDLRIMCEVAFVAAEQIEEKRELAYTWIKTTAARDIHPIVLAFTLTADDADFASLAVLPLPWMPAKQIEPGDRFLYEGTAYPLAGGRAIIVPASGEFEITGVAEDDDGELWFVTRNVDGTEFLYLTGTLLMTAVWR
jgi:hypothetical protein